jgi:hypothetical protein
MRHSFGSYFASKTKDETLTASEMGNSPGVVVRHYRAVVKDAYVAEYWRHQPRVSVLPRSAGITGKPSGSDFMAAAKRQRPTSKWF